MRTLHDRVSRTAADAVVFPVFLVVAAAGIVVLLGGCGSSMPPSSSGGRPDLLAGRHGLAPQGLTGAARVARRFALTYAAGAYRRRPPEFTAESSTVLRALAAAAGRVPADRRGLRPRLLRLRLSLRSGGSLAATASIGDGRFPSFSVGFTVARSASGWRVSSFEGPD